MDSNNNCLDVEITGEDNRKIDTALMGLSDNIEQLERRIDRLMDNTPRKNDIDLCVYKPVDATIQFTVKSNSPIDMASALIDYYVELFDVFSNNPEENITRSSIEIGQLADHLRAFVESVDKRRFYKIQQNKKPL